jgi:hypothetical protein
MTDEQWSTLTYRLKMPDAARKPIENELDIYSRFADATASPPSETRQNLERAAQLVSKLLEVIEDFGTEEHRALAESVESVAIADISALPMAYAATADRRGAHAMDRISVAASARQDGNCVMPKTAVDPFFGTSTEPLFAARNAKAVSPSDTTDLARVTSALIVTIGTGGTGIAVIMANGSDQEPVTIPLAVGTYQINAQVRRVMATGTALGTGGGVVALWS